MNIVDIIILITALFGALKGRRKGILAMISKLVGYIIAFVLAFSFYLSFGNFLNNVFGITKKINSILAKKLAFAPEINDTLIKQVPFNQLIERINEEKIPLTYKKVMTGFMQDIQNMPVNHGIHKLGEGIVYYISLFLVDIIAFMFIYLVIGFIIKLILRKTRDKVNFFYIGKFNRVGGFIAGGASSLLSTGVTLTLLAPLVTLTLMGKETGVLAGINKLIAGSSISPILINTLSRFLY